MKINILKIKVISSQLRQSAKGRLYRTYKLLVESPVFDQDLGTVHAETLIYAMSAPDFELPPSDQHQFVFVTQNQSQYIWLQAIAG